MPVVSAFTLIRLVTGAHLIFGYLLVASPERLSKINAIGVLGDALGLQQPTAHLWENPLASALAGLVMILYGVCDFVAVSSNEELAREYWGGQGPIRCFFFSALTAYIYFMRPGRDKVLEQTTPQPVVNNIMFGWAFFESIYWFWIFTNLKEERAEAQRRIAQRKKMQDEIAML